MIRTKFFIEAGKIVKDVPHGAFVFKAVDLVGRKFDYTFQTGADVRVSRASRFPETGLRRITQQAWLTNAISASDAGIAKNVTIYHGLRVMPFVFNSAFDFRTLYRIFGNILYPFGMIWEREWLLLFPF